MKLLIDQNISKRIIESITDIFPDSVHINTINMSNSSDEDVWEYALKNDFILVSTDIEIFDRSFIAEKSPKVIFIKGAVITTTKMEWAIRINEETIQQFHSEDPASCLQITV